MSAASLFVPPQAVAARSMMSSMGPMLHDSCSPLNKSFRAGAQTCPMVDPMWQRVMDEVIRQHPKQAGRAATWLAAEIGVTVAAVNNWKTRGLPAQQHAAIAQALKWSVDQLLGRTLPPQDPWPFESVSFDRFVRLSEREKGMLEGAMLDALERIESARKLRDGTAD